MRLVRRPAPAMYATAIRSLLRHFFEFTRLTMSCLNDSVLS
jgi:hypothetical protein